MKKKLEQIASKSDFNWKKELKQLKEDINWIKRSSAISTKILLELKKDDQLTQAVLAERMGVSVQYVNRIVKGKENLTLKTISKLEEALGINLIETIYRAEKKMDLLEEHHKYIVDTYNSLLLDSYHNLFNSHWMHTSLFQEYNFEGESQPLETDNIENEDQTLTLIAEAA